MSQRVNLGGAVCEIRKGRLKLGGTVYDIEQGKRKGGYLIRFAVEVPDVPALSILDLYIPLSNPGDTDRNYLVVNYVGGFTKKYAEPGRYTLYDVESLYFYCSGTTAEISINGQTVASADYGAAEHTWIPTASAVTVSFEETVHTNARKITVTTQ